MKSILVILSILSLALFASCGGDKSGSKTDSAKSGSDAKSGSAKTDSAKTE